MRHCSHTTPLSPNHTHPPTLPQAVNTTMRSDHMDARVEAMSVFKKFVTTAQREWVEREKAKNPAAGTYAVSWAGLRVAGWGRRRHAQQQQQQGGRTCTRSQALAAPLCNHASTWTPTHARATARSSCSPPPPPPALPPRPLLSGVQGSPHGAPASRDWARERVAGGECDADRGAWPRARGDGRAESVSAPPPPLPCMHARMLGAACLPSAATAAAAGT